MVGDGAHARDGRRLEVRRGAHLQRDPPVAHVGGEQAQPGSALGREVDVVDDPDAVAQAVGTAALDGLPDGRQAERLAGVDGEGQLLVN